jgi:transposase
MIDKIKSGFAAIDIGQEKFFVALAGQAVRSFGTFTSEVRLLAAYLKEHAVRAVAMEATGVYWIPLHDQLQAEGLQVTVFNGAHARNLPGRKSDVQDCQWHAMLHSHGLLQPCFIPPQEIRPLRSFYRLREDHLTMAGAHIQHMQKALDLMNVRLHNVISQIHGVSGLRVIEAILAGERDPVVLAALCAGQILNKKRAQVLKSLEGDWQEHHLFALRQGLEAYRFYQGQIAACDRELERLLKQLNQGRERQEGPKGRKKKVVRHNAPAIQDLEGELLTLCGGRNATLLPGISPLGFMKLVGELGTDLSAWKSEQHFTSWLGLAPGKHQSGRRQRRAPRRKTVAGQIFREAVLSIAKSKHLALGAFYRRLKGRKGPKVAATAVARKLAQLYYRAMTKGLEYVERGLAQYEAQYREQTLCYLNKMARRIGLSLTPLSSHS